MRMPIVPFNCWESISDCKELCRVTCAGGEGNAPREAQDPDTDKYQGRSRIDDNRRYGHLSSDSALNCVD